MLRWLGSIAAIVFLLALFGIWRLMQGPIELNWLAPYVQAALDHAGTGVKVSFSGVRLGIERGTQQIGLRAENVRVVLPDGTPLATFPEMATSFALGALLRGQLAPTQVVVERPVLHLVRSASGAISARIGAEQDGAPAPALGPDMLEQLAGPPRRDAPLGLLRHIGIRGATVIVDDQSSGRTWRASRVDIAAERGSKGTRGDISFALPIGGSLPELHATYRYFAERHVLDLAIAVDGVEPAAIPPLIPELAQLQHVDAPVSGTLQTRIDLDRRVAQGSRLDLSLGKGTVHSDWLPSGGVAVGGGELRAVYAPENEEIRVETLTLDLGDGAVLELAGTLSGVTPELIAAPRDGRPAGQVGGTFTAALKNVPTARLQSLWPSSFSPGGRRWVLENVSDGIIGEASARVAVDLDPVAHTVSMRNATGALRYHDLTVHYFDGLPPFHKVSGTAAFAGNHLDFTPTDGVLKGLKVTGGSMQLSELGGKTEWLTIDLSLAGPLRDALEIIDAKPLGYARAIGIDPAQVGGRAETQLHFSLPLLADLKLAAVDYGAKAAVSRASIEKVALDRGLSDADLVLDLTKAGAHLQGTARFDGIPSKIDANVFFHARSGPHASCRVGLTLDNDAQRRLGFDLAVDRLSGPIAVDVAYAAFSGNRGEATALFDLRGAALSIPEAGWKKPVGQPGTAKLIVDLDHEAVAKIPQIEIKAAGLDGNFAVHYAADHKQIERVDIRHLQVADNDLAGTLSRRVGGGWRADIRAARADARHLLDDAASGAPASTALPLVIYAGIDRLVLGANRELRQVNGELLRLAGVWRTIRIDGRLDDGHRIALRLGEGADQRFILQSDDLGATLKAFDIADHVVGGQLRVDGQLSEDAGKRVLRAHVEGQNYTIVNAPVMARLLALPSLTGLASTLSGSGLPFMTLRGDLTFTDGRVTLDRLLAYGEALGVTAKGWIDVDRDWLDLQGTFAPAYALNSIIGNVPIIGPLLGGGSQGLFAANYRVSGKSTDPQVTVNPLSALAPGILRQLFDPLVGVPEPAAAPPPEAKR